MGVSIPHSRHLSGSALRRIGEPSPSRKISAFCFMLICPYGAQSIKSPFTVSSPFRKFLKNFTPSRFQQKHDRIKHISTPPLGSITTYGRFTPPAPDDISQNEPLRMPPSAPPEGGSACSAFLIPTHEGTCLIGTDCVCNHAADWTGHVAETAAELRKVSFSRSIGLTNFCATPPRYALIGSKMVLRLFVYSTRSTRGSARFSRRLRFREGKIGSTHPLDRQFPPP